MITILAFVFVLGVLVFVHELGHFLAAKRVGIRVLKFQLGFNPTIFSFRRGDTEYGIGALPLGGYVKMAGESLEDAERDEHGELVKRPDEFLSKTKWQRFQVLIMGPAMNVLLAVVVLAVVLYRGADVPIYEDQAPVVGVVTPGSPAAGVGIRPGDRITAVADHGVDTWEQFYLAIGARPNKAISVDLVRDGMPMSKMLTVGTEPGSRFEIGDIGVLPNVHPHLVAVVPGEPAAQAGLKPGDVIVAVNRQPVTFRPELIKAIAAHPLEPITIAVERDGTRHDIPITPAHGGCTGVQPDVGCIGVSIAEATKSVRPSAIGAVQLSVQKNVELAGMIGQTVWGLLTREISRKQLMGPIAIAQLSGESAQLGWLALLSLMSSISLNLGLLNLLPIPVLDGGHIFIMAMEGLTRRDFSVRVKEKMLLAGFVVLMMLMVTVIYNDLTRISWFDKILPWR